MNPILQHPRLSRAAGTPLYGKRTERLETSVSALTKQLIQEEAKAAGFATVADWAHSLIVRELHGVTVTRVFLGSKK